MGLLFDGTPQDGSSQIVLAIQKDKIFEWHVLPWTKFYLKNQVWPVQQDSALACEAKIVPPGCLAKFSRFSTTCKRPATSADRNLLDYSVYRISQSRVRERPQPNLKSLEKILEPGRTQLSPKHPRVTVDAFPKRLIDLLGYGHCMTRPKDFIDAGQAVLTTDKIGSGHGMTRCHVVPGGWIFRRKHDGGTNQWLSLMDSIDLDG
ncbi:hypothetical protein B9Z55_006711 [Caenorhabditis nigoni]|uniref:Uncharacterized protein n=1 Tax=Caenorhabditis nigoni TaxID=1611254 RepID=A0A2G5V6G1_9PELO|nr:hypothetical protein B9Z55_006711 [Caenorhabditis nigoni]